MAERERGGAAAGHVELFRPRWPLSGFFGLSVRERGGGVHLSGSVLGLRCYKDAEENGRGDG